jgi:hypothetical protein
MIKGLDKFREHFAQHRKASIENRQPTIEDHQSQITNVSVSAPAAQFADDIAHKALGVTEEHEGFILVWDQSGTAGFALNIPDREYLSQSTQLDSGILPIGNKCLIKSRNCPNITVREY